jgi:hypothetical protein
MLHLHVNHLRKRTSAIIFDNSSPVLFICLLQRPIQKSQLTLLTLFSTLDSIVEGYGVWWESADFVLHGRQDLSICTLIPYQTEQTQPGFIRFFLLCRQAGGCCWVCVFSTNGVQYGVHIRGSVFQVMKT